MTRPAVPLQERCTAWVDGVRVRVGSALGVAGGADEWGGFGVDGRADVGGRVDAGADDVVGEGTAAVLLAGSWGAAMLVTWEPAREIAHHTAVVDSTTSTTQTPAHATSGSRLFITTSCLIRPTPPVA